MASSASAAVGDNAYLKQLIEQATVARLADEREWHVLLHYQPNLFGRGFTSMQDDPGFFMDPAGKTDPQAELAATLAQFFSDELVGRSKQTAQCAFVARYHWLKEKLHFDERRLPPQFCERFTRWFNEFNAQSISVIFPTGFMNNPASMFGHTFLRIDAKGQTRCRRTRDPSMQSKVSSAAIGGTSRPFPTISRCRNTVISRTETFGSTAWT